MKKTLSASLLVTTALMLTANSAQAISLSRSDKTDQTTVIFKINGGVNLPFNLTVFGGAEIIPFYSNIVGSNKVIEGTELWSAMTNVEANLGYNFNLLNAETIVGDFNPTLTPFAGYKHFFAHTGSSGNISFTNIAPTTSLANIGGLNYGLRFTSSIPLGFRVYAEGGATSLLNGNYSQDNPADSAVISGSGAFLPSFRAGASWSLLELASISIGYGASVVPDIRTKTGINSAENATVHSIDLGLRILFFSI